MPFAPCRVSAAIEDIGNYTFRVLIGAMWWQQSLWKLPPFYPAFAG